MVMKIIFIVLMILSSFARFSSLARDGLTGVILPPRPPAALRPPDAAPRPPDAALRPPPAGAPALPAPSFLSFPVKIDLIALKSIIVAIPFNYMSYRHDVIKNVMVL